MSFIPRMCDKNVGIFFSSSAVITASELYKFPNSQQLMGSYNAYDIEKKQVKNCKTRWFVDSYLAT